MVRARLSRTVVGAVLALPVPVLGGDWPDPSFIRDGEDYVAVSTSGGWAPPFRVLRSKDLRSWQIAGAAFRGAPRWAKGGLWAPELTRLNGGYAIFYSALPRRRWWSRGSGSWRRGRPWYCLGVATAPTAAGPYRGSGRPLRCSRYGSIDPYPVRDERGRLHLLWKEDGNAFRRPTPILAQRLSEDGRRLRGRPREIIRNRDPWERRVVEAPTVVRRDGFFYLFYSANLCCTEHCAYAVGVARSPTLGGRWEKYSGNPILRGGNGWRCPGHASVVADATGGYKALFHAYRTGAGLLIGRQLLVDDVTFGPDGWPRIGTGLPAAPLAGATSTAFSDSFAGPGLAAAWEWPIERVPGIRAAGGLRLRAPGRGGQRVDAGVLSRRVGTDRYVATAIIDRGALRGRALAGLASYHSRSVAIGMAVGRRRLIVWQRHEGRYKVLAQTYAPPAPFVHLRLTGRRRTMRFAFGSDGQRWTPVGTGAKSPVEESARLALTAGGAMRAVARFTQAALTEESPHPRYPLPAESRAASATVELGGQDPRRRAWLRTRGSRPGEVWARVLIEGGQRAYDRVMRPCGLTVIVLALLIAPAAGATAPRSASLAGVPAAGAQQRPPICQFLPFPPGCRQPPSQPPPDPRGIDPSSPNPLRGLRFFVDPQEPSFRDYLRFRQSGAQALADRMLKLAGQPKFRWFGRFNHDLRAAVRGYVDRAAARGEVPLLVTLRHQGRQCNPRYTAGGAAEDKRTKRWFEDFARAVGGSRVVIGFEPDSVGTVECLARSRRRARLEVLRHGVDVLSRLPNATIYLEATASDWKSAALVAGRLRYIGIAKVRGFMLNATHYAWTASNIRYGLAVSSRVGGKPFVISTAMNGRGPVHYRRTVNRRKRTYRRINVHCHPLYRGLGPSPTTDTSHPKVDAYLWINRPGYSGGSCNGGPVPVGRWWQARALMFARYATSWERPPPGTRFGFPTGRLSINRAAGDQYKP